MTTLSLGQPYRRGAAPKAGIEAVRETDTDALTSRLAACRAGYLPPDSYAEMQASPQSREAHRPPLISIGTYLRAREMDRHMEHFLATGSLRQETASSTTPVQVINIGAGSDTRFWRMSMATSNVALYVELDFPETTRQKAACIEQHEAMQMPLGSWTRTDDGLEADKYWLVGADLSTLRTSETWDRLRSRLDPSYPTLIVCECVLAYLDAEQANTLLQGWLEQLSHVAILSYDICLGGDAPDTQEPTRFGRVMLQNLAVRRLTLPGARQCISPEAYTRRFVALAHASLATASEPHMHLAQEAYSLREAWLQLPRAERERVSQLERLDEVEEMEMLLAHYCMAWVEKTIVQ